MKKHAAFGGVALVLAMAGLCVGETVALFPTESATIQGTTDAGQSEGRLLVRFDLVEIPQKAIVTDASLFLDGVVLPELNGWICLYAAPLTSEWDADGVTWDGPTPGAEWNSPGGDWEFAMGDYGCWGSQDGASDVEETQLIPRLNITTLVIRQLVAPETQKGLILFPSDIVLPDADASSVELVVIWQVKPRLVVEYEMPADAGWAEPAVRPGEREGR